jgi:hypothetical protein
LSFCFSHRLSVNAPIRPAVYHSVS